METGSAAHGAASPLNSCLSLRAVTSALKWRWRWRASQKKGGTNNKAAFFHKGDLSPFYEPATYSSVWKEATVMSVEAFRCWWKRFMEVLKEKDLHWADGKSSISIFTFITSYMHSAISPRNRETKPFLPNHSVSPVLPRIVSTVTFSFCSWLSIYQIFMAMETCNNDF